MLFLKKHPQYLFRIEVRPEFVNDLADADEAGTELLIRGKTKNLERLRSFSNLEKLWIYTVNQREFDTILSLVHPKMLYIYEMRVNELSLLENQTNVEVMALEWNTKTTHLWDLSKNTSLKALSITDFSKLNEITPLQDSKSIEILDLAGGIWNTLKLDTLEPLQHLSQLKYLGLKVQTESLEPVSHLIGLQELSISNQFPTEEYTRLSVTLPQTHCDEFQPYVKMDDPIDEKDVTVTGKRKPFLISETDGKRLQKYEAQFKAFQDKYKT